MKVLDVRRREEVAKLTLNGGQMDVNRFFGIQ